MTAIAGTFSDFKLVKTRGVAQLVIEVPVEQAYAALEALGGLPMPDQERWVGIAPLAAAPQTQLAPQLGKGQEKESRPFHTLPPSQQAAIKCGDPDFLLWLVKVRLLNVAEGRDPGPDDAAEAVRRVCGVTSRAQITADPRAAQVWRNMLSSYEDYRLGRK